VWHRRNHSKHAQFSDNPAAAKHAVKGAVICRHANSGCGPTRCAPPRITTCGEVKPIAAAPGNRIVAHAARAATAGATSQTSWAAAGWAAAGWEVSGARGARSSSTTGLHGDISVSNQRAVTGCDATARLIAIVVPCHTAALSCVCCTQQYVNGLCNAFVQLRIAPQNPKTPLLLIIGLVVI
jgi:hypothetical protein